MLDLVRDHLAGRGGDGFPGLLRAGSARAAAAAAGGDDVLRVLALYHEAGWFPGGFAADADPDVLAAIHADLPPGGDPRPALAADLVRSAGGWRFLVVGSTRVSAEAGAAAARRMAGAAHGWVARAVPAGDAGLVAHGLLVAADLLRLGGLTDDAGAHLQEAHDLLVGIGDVAGVAHCHLLVADAHLTPWSSPELGGLDPWDHGRDPTPVTPDAAVAAGEACAAADDAFDRADAPRGRAAVAMRRSVLAAATGRWDDAHAEARAAARFAAGAGDRALALLADTHTLLAAVAGGRPDRLRTSLPVAVAGWARGEGSGSYARGLVRLLRGSGLRMLRRGAAEDARITLTVAAELAAALEHPAEDAACLAATAELYGALNTRGPTIGTLHRVLAAHHGGSGVEDWMEEVGALVALEGQYLLERHPDGQGWCAARAAELLDRAPVHAERDDEDLFVAIRRRLDALPELGRRRVTAAGVAAPAGFTDDMARSAVQTLLDVVDQAAVRVPLTRALELRRDGFDGPADAGFAAALRAADALGDRGRSLRVLALIADRRRPEAVAALGQLREQVPDYPDDLAVDLLVAAHDHAAAARLAPVPDTGWRGLLAPAEIALRTGDPATAAALLDTARADFERHVAGLRRDPFRVSVTDDSAARWLYLLAAEAAAARGDVAGSLVLGDRLRSLPLLALLAGADPARARANAIWSAAFDLFAWTGTRAVAPPAGDDPALDLLDGDAAALLDRAQAAMEEAEASVPRRAAASVPAAPDVAALRAHLPAGTLLVQYLMAGDRLVVWALAADVLDVAVTDLDTDRLTGDVRRVHDACAGQFVLGDPEASRAELGARLLGPVAAHLERFTRVVVVPSGPLHLLPFAVLPWAGDVLGATHVLSVLPAAALLPVLRPAAPAPGAVLVVGDPDFAPGTGLARLPGTRVESTLVAAHHGVAALLGADATAAAVAAHLPAARVVHLATHGLVSRIAPTASALALAGRDRLGVADLAGLRIDADLVVLSACDSGRGDTTLGGDVVGLARQLLAVGARAALVCLWPVDDESTCLLMERFHALLAARVPAAEALAAAQRDLRSLDRTARDARYEQLCARAGVPVEVPALRRSASGVPAPSTAHEWAAFVLIGTC